MTDIAIERLQAKDISPELSAALLALGTATPMRAQIVEREYPRAGVTFQGYVFMQPDDYVLLSRGTEGQPVGMAVTKLRRALWNGEPTAVNYIFHGRVHAAHQHRGIGRALARACLEIGDELGASVQWATVGAENVASLATLHRAGFAEARPMRLAGLPMRNLAGLPEPQGLVCSIASPADFAQAADLLNGFYNGYNNWIPLSGKGLDHEMHTAGPGVPNYRANDLFVVRDGEGQVRATALVYDQARVARQVVEGLNVPFAWVTDWLGPIIRLSPIAESFPRIGREHPKLYLHYFAASDRASALALLGGIAREWERRASSLPVGRRAVMLVCQDELNLTGTSEGLLANARLFLGRGGYVTHVHVLSKPATDPATPWWLNPWT